jgi:MYXO-CTERM domain-containing protein
MKQPLNPLRPATAALFAALAFSTAPVFAQTTAAPAPAPTISAPPPTITAPPAPVTVAPPVAATPAPRATPAPQARTTTPRARPAAPARTANRAPAPRVAAPAPAPAATPAPTPAPAPIAEAPAPVVAEAPAAPPPTVEPAPPAEQPAARTSMLPFIIGAAALLILALGFLALRRRRRTDDVYEDAVYEETYEQPAVVEQAPAAPYAEPALAGAPFAPEPTFIRTPVAETADDTSDVVSAASIEEVEVVGSDAADIEALAADSEPVAGRPWIEFLMRPVRAGTSKDNAIVEFELTVGNTGSVSARDVRISTWVVAAGEGSEMERSLIEPSADATHNTVDIAAGDGARVEAKIAMAKGGLDQPVLPVVVADARYTLPDGSEGRTHASFAVGVPEEDGSELQPFRVDGSSGLRENVEARLYGEPERV